MFEIGIFPLLMVAATTIFFPSDWLRPEESRRTAGSESADVHAPQPLSGRQRWTLAALGLYLAWQALMPFRHWLYPGPVSWTEEGHRFSWHMKLRTKSATVVFHAYDDEGQQLTTFPAPEEILLPRQRDVMSERPDMLLQYAHFVRDGLQRQGHRNVHVWADEKASLNGRKPQPLVDPNVDLAAQPRNLWHADWIVPLYEPRPTLEQARQRLAEKQGGVKVTEPEEPEAL